MFGFAHAPELILLVVIALVIFGPKRLPEVGRGIGRGLRNFRTETEAMRVELSSIDDEVSSVREAALTPTLSGSRDTEPAPTR